MHKLYEATIDDSCVIASLIRRAFHRQAEILRIRSSECPNYAGFDSSARVHDRFGQGYRVLRVDSEDRLVGVVTFRPAPDHPSRGEITRLAVLPEFRGTGFGALLMKAAEDALGCAGVNTIEISIVAEFGRLQAYYESLGYVPTRKRRFSTLPFEVQFLEKSIARSSQTRNM